MTKTNYLLNTLEILAKSGVITNSEYSRINRRIMDKFYYGKKVIIDNAQIIDR